MLLTIFLALAPRAALAVTCDACGESATYTETLSWMNGYCSGKDIRGCGGNYGEGTETKADVLDLEFDVPAIPVIASTVEDFECSMGAIGIALNGVQFYGGAVERTDDDDPGCELLDVSSTRGEWMGFDFCSGHTGGANGFNPYHYHFPPSCLLDQAGARARGANHRETTSVSHSPQIGWALDGFPVYGQRRERHGDGARGERLRRVALPRLAAAARARASTTSLPLLRDRPDVGPLLAPVGPEAARVGLPVHVPVLPGLRLVGPRLRDEPLHPGSAGVARRCVPARPATDNVSAEATAYWYAQNGDDAMAPLCASEPTAAPTTATWAPTTEAHLKICATEAAGQRGTCEAAGGVCYTAEAHCVGDGGAFLANRCGADCGCCVKQPSPAPTPPRRRAVASADHGRAVDRPGVPARRGRAGVALRGPRRRVLRVEPHVRGGRRRLPREPVRRRRGRRRRALRLLREDAVGRADVGARGRVGRSGGRRGPGTAGFNSLYVILVLTFMSLVIFSLAAVGKFQYDKLKALEHKTERHRMSTRTRTEMVAAPAVV
ncbi:hypothetical protein JL720_17048 [Aureococcus anophagefferens]|nr:hypothetical protein JL720_17048 [Aureococcus anophagefferens]